MLFLIFQTGADALFVMNYPGYIGEASVDDKYHENHPGLGYKYTSEQAMPSTDVALQAFLCHLVERFKFPDFDPPDLIGLVLRT